MRGTATPRHSVSRARGQGFFFRYPELNALWARRIAGFREPTARYIKVVTDEEASTHKGSNEDLLIGTRATYLAIGQDGKGLFRAAKPNYFARMVTRQLEGLMWSLNAWLAVRLTSNKKLNNVEAVLLRQC